MTLRNIPSTKQIITEVLMFISVVFIFLMGVKVANLEIACNVKGEYFEDQDWSFYGGCMVLHKGKWIPLKNIRID